MQLIPVSENFIHLVDALEPRLLADLLAEFNSTDHWERLTTTDLYNHTRLQLGVDGQLSEDVDVALRPIIDMAEARLGVKLYQNTTQLWLDGPGYLNQPHCDFSPNLVVNIQVYLADSVTTDIGTCCFDQAEWRQVPYALNQGYILFNPTQIQHGMQRPVQDRRLSLYQSYRATEIASDIW
jgi:hypothetical protein